MEYEETPFGTRIINLAEGIKTIVATNREDLSEIKDLEFELAVVKGRMWDLIDALELADIHVGWGNETLKSVHQTIRSALEAVKEQS